MEAKMMIAGSFDEFVEKVTQAERKALNTPFGQEITEKLLAMKLTIENPNSSSGRSLIMFRDSFGSSIAPLIAEGFDRVTLVDIRYVAPELLGRMIDFSQYTDALFLYGTGVINNSETIK